MPRVSQEDFMQEKNQAQIGPRNQIEQLEKELHHKNNVIEEQNKELLALYRRLSSTGGAVMGLTTDRY